MNTGTNESSDAANATETLRVDLQECRRELDECRKRVEELKHGEDLLAGENRILEMVARGESLSLILDGIRIYPLDIR